MNSMQPRRWSDTELIDANREFYDSLWSAARLIGPESFNTWPLVCALVSSSRRSLEVAPGLRPRLPLAGTLFLDVSVPAVTKLWAHGASAVVGLVTSLTHRDNAFDLVCAFDVLVGDDMDLKPPPRTAPPRQRSTPWPGHPRK